MGTSFPLSGEQVELSQQLDVILFDEVVNRLEKKEGLDQSGSLFKKKKIFINNLGVNAPKCKTTTSVAQNRETPLISQACCLSLNLKSVCNRCENGLKY